MRVLAGWRPRGASSLVGFTRYPGRITLVNKKEGVVAVDYDDGDQWDKVPVGTLRRIEGMESVKCCPVRSDATQRRDAPNILPIVV